MAWAVPEHSKSAVDRAGATFINRTASPEDRELALTRINNWRSSHSFPLNTMQVYLRDTAGRYDRDPTAAQRIKRLPSIRLKLENNPGMKLSRMQDIGGCRAVVSSVETLAKVVNFYKNTSSIKHRLVREDPYIAAPKASGYRGVHLVYRYTSDRTPTYNGLAIEIQLRSRLQHAWATAVETVGAFTQQALKSSLGEEDWLRFFALMSSALAIREGTPTVPGTPGEWGELAREIRGYATRLDVINRMTTYQEAMRTVEDLKARGETYLLELDIGGRETTLRSYVDPALAAEAYTALELATADDPGKDVVLVRADSMVALRRAYPNYFLDTTAFVESVSEAVA